MDDDDERQFTADMARLSRAFIDSLTPTSVRKGGFEAAVSGDRYAAEFFDALTDVIGDYQRGFLGAMLIVAKEPLGLQMDKPPFKKAEKLLTTKSTQRKSRSAKPQHPRSA